MQTKRSWLIFILLALAALSLAACNALSQGAAGGDQAGEPEAAQRAAEWLVDVHQNDDGGYASFSTGANQAPSTVTGTLDAILALSAAGLDPGSATRGQESSALDYLRANSESVGALAAEDGGQAGKVSLALTAAGVDPRDFGGTDYVATLQAHLLPTGVYGVEDAYKQSLAILGLAAAGEPVPAAALEWLANSQSDSGAWGDGFGTAENPDATAMVLMALLAGGRELDDAAVVRGVEFLAAAQTAEAGWGYGPGLGTGANSTALVIQALSALGEAWDDGGGPWGVEGHSPLDALMAFQGESGAFQTDYGDGPFDDFFATVQSVPALVGRPFPLPAWQEVR